MLNLIYKLDGDELPSAATVYGVRYDKEQEAVRLYCFNQPDILVKNVGGAGYMHILERFNESKDGTVNINLTLHHATLDAKGGNI